MIVPLAERSTTGCGAGGCRLAASAGITQVAMTPLNAAAINGRTTDTMSPPSLSRHSSLICQLAHVGNCHRNCHRTVQIHTVPANPVLPTDRGKPLHCAKPVFIGPCRVKHIRPEAPKTHPQRVAVSQKVSQVLKGITVTVPNLFWRSSSAASCSPYRAN